MIELRGIGRPNGGHLRHIIAMGHGMVALCGYKPSSPKGSLIRNRGHWASIEKLPAEEASCKRCLEAWEKLNCTK